MILGSDSHTRYGALGTLAVGEGGGELAKQLVGRTYDIARPQVVCVYLHGAPRPGVGPQDVALAICGEVYACGYVKNRVMEFVGPGVASLPMDFRNGIDVMTTETGRSDRSRGHRARVFLRPVLRRGRYARQRRIVHPPYHAQLPKP